MRRRALLSTLAATGIAGCAGNGRLPFLGSSATTSNGTVIRFSSGITESIRKRCLRAFERTMSITETALSDPIRVTLEEPQLDGYTHPIGYGQLAATAPTSNLWVPRDTSIPGTLGSYDPEERVLRFANPSKMPETLFEEIGGLPEISFNDFPTDPFIAHEFAHALANDASGEQTTPTGIDARAASRGVAEGTAEYIQRTYHISCTNNEYESCSLRRQIPSNGKLPLWMVPGRLPYVNGMPLVYQVLQREGWDGIWRLHENPPETAAEVMFPDRYFLEESLWQSVDTHPEAEGQWNQFKSSRMGVNHLYVLFRALDIIPAVSASSAVPSTLTEETGLQHVFRAEMLRQWRGDRMTQYMNGNNRTGYYWETEWFTRQAARMIANAVADRHDEQGDSYGEGWRVGSGISEVYVNVIRSNTTIAFAMAPSKTALQDILPS